MAASSWERVGRLFGVGGPVAGLPGERTRNARVDAPGGRVVLKVHPLDERSAVEAEIIALDRVAGLAGVPGLDRVPRVLRTPDGAAVVEATLDGVPGLARAVTWLPGVPWGQAWTAQRPAPDPVLADLGRLVAEVDAALAGVDVPGLGAGLRWNLLHADQVRDLLPHVGDPVRRGLAGDVFDRFVERVAPALRDLPLQTIHNDASDGNVLVEVGPDGTARVSGLIDFGDVCRAPRICGLAVACAYAMAGRTDPIGAVRPLVAGYHEVVALTPAELALLPDLIRARLAVSVVMAGWQSARDPGNDYLLVSQDRVGPLLGELVAADDELARFRFRDACGYEADPAARGVRRFLSRVEPAPVVGGRPAAEMSRLTFDWSAGTGAGTWTPQRLADRLAGAGAELGIGRYLEDRDVYTSDAYRPTGGTGERRTVHLGVDLFVPAGSPVTAPLSGVVHALNDNAALLDYGPVVILEHCTDDGVRFFTLYGHLARTTLQRLTVGHEVAAGEVFATVGTPEENGGWAPHVHLQVLTSLLGRGVDVPGVGARGDLGVWRSVCPDPNLLLGLPEGVRAEPGMTTPQLASARRLRLSPALSLSYARPLRMVRGRGAHLFDDEGRAWLDLVNNVAHVGHGHPRVVAAAARQQDLLNTNTRYLHEAVVEYAQRLTATLPDPLTVCFFVNSGSEANDLALRLARAHTGSREVMVLDHAYHGNLTSLVDVSPYKFDGPGGSGRPEHTHVVPLPDPFRGRHRTGPGEPSSGVAAAYLAELDAVLAGVPERDGRRPAAFLAEAMPGTAGQVVLADGFLAGAYRRVREAGGICIADEVQTGFGRLGSAFWAFEQHGAVPDVVTLGKPIGNGHPLGAVVTTPQVAASFVTGMEYFNTFGGNPVSARIGLTVLDVLDDERLPAQAAVVGRRLLAGFGDLAARHELVGDVRGSGLFLGLELVSDRRRRTPAGPAAGRVVEAVKQRGVLLSRDGPDGNVLKIKPPMVLSVSDAELVVTVLDEALSQVAAGGA